MSDDAEWLPALAGELERWSHLGDRRFDTGGRVIGYMPDKVELAWLHRLRPPLDVADLVAAERALDSPLPEPFRAFLQVMNGASFFFRLISIYGHVARLSREPSALGQSISLRYGNVVERAVYLPEGVLCIGSLAGQSIACRYYMMPDGSVRLTRSHDGSLVAAEWGGFGDMLLAEVRRLGALHKDRGDLTAGAHEIWPEAARGWDQP